MKTILSAIALASLSTTGAIAAEQSVAPSDNTLAAASISKGEHLRAIAILEDQLEQHPNDPAFLINLGIAHAQRGEDERARARFEAALDSRESIDLETADGSLIDSRRLARQALSMLDRGVFSQGERNQGNLSLRD